MAVVLRPWRACAPPRMSSARAFLLVLVLGGTAASCATPPPVRPWQREYLSRRAMRFDDGLEGRFRQHLYGSREGADGGNGHVGGGCGCN
jgi:hypothetical protein